ncbi:MAG: energy transducer TonB [Deltaproteobacteria bacterium]|nr:energy transducer TonB [Deltaproteobacteria bacterium]
MTPQSDLVRLDLVDRRPKEVVQLRSHEKPFKGQVVQLPKPEKEVEPPDDARFLSKYNSRVKKEQRSRHRGRTPKARPMAVRSARKKAGVQKRAHGKTARKQKAGTDVALPMRTGPTAGVKGFAGLSRLLMPTLGGSPGASAVKAVGGRGAFMSDDAVLGVREEGDTTLLNARSFKYWDFFQRVKERVRGEWDPGPAYRSRDPYGKVYGSTDRLTVLSVTLDAKGKVLRMEVARESGLPFLDKEALKSFREASPFPNPPAGLADDRGRISFSFGFLLDLSSSKQSLFWKRPR